MKDKKVITLCEGAIMVALAQILGYIKLGRLPQGGSVTLAMLPIFVFAYRRGFKLGLIASFALGLLQCTLDNSWNWGWQSILFDYILAYGILGIAGLWSGKKNGIYVGACIGGLARLIMHTISGYLYVKEYLDLEIFGLHTSNPWIYSIIYNGSYMVLSLLACLIVIFILDKKNLLKIYL